MTATITNSPDCPIKHTQEECDRDDNPNGYNWRFIELIDKFQAELPEKCANDARIAEEASEIYTTAISQKVASKTDVSPKDMIVEFTQGFIKVPYQGFIKELPITKWGYENLALWSCGELRDSVKVKGGVSTDEYKEVRQVERMKFDSLDLNSKTDIFKKVVEKVGGKFIENKINLDMTKREIIRIWNSNLKSKVYWQVFYSDNKTVNDDIGSLEFKDYKDGTLVTFHSAHHLAIQELFPDKIVGCTLSNFFKDSVIKYKEIVSKEL